MHAFDLAHGRYVHGRRVSVLCRHLAELVPPGARVLDVGCGDGQLAGLLARQRPDLTISGIDVLVRDETVIPVREFDGERIPHGDGEVDVVLLVDVLHHTTDPMALLREACRVAARAVVIKDHLRDGWLAEPTLRFMDRVGNAQHGVHLPYNYWSLRQWDEAFGRLALQVDTWNTALRLYPWPVRPLFERSLHFVARLLRDQEEQLSRPGWSK